MPQFTDAKNNFTSGELDPRLNARDDVAQYANGLEKCENFQIMPFGGVKKRHGTAYVAEVKTSSKKVRVVRFEFNVEQAYIIEFGDLYLRFYKDNGQILDGAVPYEIVTPYLEADLPTLKFTQSADVLYVAHPNYKPRKISRTGHTSWTITEINFQNGPFLDDNTTATTIKSSGVTGNVTLTADASIFLAGHVGALWKLTRGSLASLVEETIAALNAVTSSISLAGSTIVYRSAGTWVGQITIERSFDNGSTWSGYETFTTNTTREFTDTRDVLFRAKMTQYTSGSATIRLAQLSTQTEGFGVVRITGYTSGLIVSATVLEELSEETIGDSDQHIINGDFDTDIAGWDDLSTGVGASIAWNAGQFMDLIGSAAGVAHAEQAISGIIDTGIDHNLSFDVGVGAVTLQIGTTTGGQEVLTATAYAIGSHTVSFIPGAATVYVQFKHSINATRTLDNVGLDSILADSDQTSYWAEGSWSDVRGWPRAIGFYQQRLGFASTDHEPSNVWLSKTGDFEDFKAGVDDDEALVYGLAAQGVNVVRWLMPWKIFAIGTAGAEWRISGSTLSEAITPTNVNANSETSEGSADLQAIQAAKSILFIDRTAKNVRELTYSFTEDAYSSPILNQLAKHITEAGIVSFAYQKNPDSIVWFVLTDGKMVGLTYNPDQKIVAFYTFVTDGLVESVATIPGSNGNDEVWISVKRTIDGATVRYIEYLNDQDQSAFEDQFFVDSGLTYSGVAATTLSGLDHLEGEEVAILGNNGVHDNKTITGGAITLSTAVTKAHVGLPYTATLKTMPFTQGAADGSGQGRLKSVDHLTFNIYKSISLKFGKDSSTLKEVFFSSSSTPTLFTGLKQLEYQGAVDETQQITVVSDKPTPLSILSIVARGDTSQL